MFRIVAIVVVASTTFDLYFLDGKYTNAVQTTTNAFCIMSSGFELVKIGNDLAFLLGVRVEFCALQRAYSLDHAAPQEYIADTLPVG